MKVATPRSLAFLGLCLSVTGAAALWFIHYSEGGRVVAALTSGGPTPGDLQTQADLLKAQHDMATRAPLLWWAMVNRTSLAAGFIGMGFASFVGAALLRTDRAEGATDAARSDASAVESRPATTTRRAIAVAVLLVLVLVIGLLLWIDSVARTRPVLPYIYSLF